MDTIAQMFGMGFVGIILVCLVWTVMSYIFSSKSRDRNKKLLDNMELVIFSFLLGIAIGMYISSQIESHIDKNIKN